MTSHVICRILNGNLLWVSKNSEHFGNGQVVVENSNGTKEWFYNGLCHREGGPAVITTKGSKIWFTNGKQHRLDGPAVEYYGGDAEYWVNGAIYDTYLEYIVAAEEYNQTSK